ncbi:MAG TPA: aldolase, partial [Erythrobacter sp.]|nr:aldolase [Erythrobacter sp.]
PPNTAGLVEVRNVGVIELPVGEGPVALLLALDPGAARFPLEIATRTIAGVAIPVLPFAPGDAAQALRAEHALREHGLPLPKPGESA